MSSVLKRKTNGKDNKVKQLNDLERPLTYARLLDKDPTDPYSKRLPDIIIGIYGPMCKVILARPMQFNEEGLAHVFGMGQHDTITTTEPLQNKQYRTGGVWVPLDKLYRILMPKSESLTIAYVRQQFVEAVVLHNTKVVKTLLRFPAGTYKLALPGSDKVVKTWLPPLLYMVEKKQVYCGFDLSSKPQNNPYTLYPFPFNHLGSGEMCMGQVKFERFIPALHLYASKANFDTKLPFKDGFGVDDWLKALSKKDIKTLVKNWVPFTWDITK